MGFETLLKRLDKLGNQKQMVEQVSNALANRLVEIAEMEYSTNINQDQAHPLIGKESLGIGYKSISAIAKGLTFEEYGTGNVGRGTYDGKLPTQPITFQSVGGTYTTNGWEYYYPNPLTKVNVNGVDGWYNGSTFHTGEVARQQMYNSSMKLQKEISRVGGEVIREILHNV